MIIITRKKAFEAAEMEPIFDFQHRSETVLIFQEWRTEYSFGTKEIRREFRGMVGLLAALACMAGTLVQALIDMPALKKAGIERVMTQKGRIIWER